MDKRDLQLEAALSKQQAEREFLALTDEQFPQVAVAASLCTFGRGKGKDEKPEKQ